MVSSGDIVGLVVGTSVVALLLAFFTGVLLHWWHLGLGNPRANKAAQSEKVTKAHFQGRSFCSSSADSFPTRGGSASTSGMIPEIIIWPPTTDGGEEETATKSAAGDTAV
eukprot:TRINITY_DN16696_c0_g1_i1.p1 TRINITY_DN16696_c0_g1~~TRINITY_DN16696_c0_g1_i1.p1  ORF type:complete len:110 (+),score=21.59 TRINITY_DN16696_c0_g1_i1:42-371(+)